MVWLNQTLAVLSAVFSCAALIFVLVAVNRVSKIHDMINSRLSQLLQTTGDLRYLEGRENERGSDKNGLTGNKGSK